MQCIEGAQGLSRVYVSLLSSNYRDPSLNFPGEFLTALIDWEQMLEKVGQAKLHVSIP
jgi:hypothetical protein